MLEVGCMFSKLCNRVLRHSFETIDAEKRMRLGKMTI